MVASDAVADEVRSRWGEVTAEEGERLAWAYYRLVALGTPDRLLSFVEFRRHRRVVLVASVVIGRWWQCWADPRRPRLWRSTVADVAANLWFRLWVLVWPTLLLGRSGLGRLPRLPVRRRLRRSHPHRNGKWSYSVRTPYACLGENGYRTGWYRSPVWDDQWRIVSAALTRAGVWTDGGEPVEPVTGLPVRGGQVMPDRAELEAQQERREQELERLGDRLKEIAGDLIELADAHRPVRREREDSPPGDPPSSPPPSSSLSGSSGGSSYSDGWGVSHDFNWD